MKKLVLLIVLLSIKTHLIAQEQINHSKIQEDFDDLITNIRNHYVYLADKKIDFGCVKDRYSQKIKGLQNESDVILFFENLLNEFYDSHISLSTNIKESYRLSSPIHVAIENKKVLITNVWQTQIENLDIDIIGAEILKFNDNKFLEKINNFPTLCNDKTNPEVRNWIANKILAGKYSEARILSLRLKNGKNKKLDLDKLKLRNEQELLTIKTNNGFGYIRINNSLGNNQLITAFDNALDQLFETRGLIIDLRNTNNGGNTYVAKGIMSRFIKIESPYQKHLYSETFDNQPLITRSWYELVSPRGEQYTKPVVVLVGRWTGSMGEGLAVGFEGIRRAKIVGTEMKRLAGSDYDFRFKHQNFGYKLITQKLFHINGKLREEYVPSDYQAQTTTTKDEILEKGIKILNNYYK